MRAVPGTPRRTPAADRSSGRLVTSAMRSSSVAPFGLATVASQPTMPVAMSNASRRPPAVPTNRPPRVDRAAGVIAHGQRGRDALVDPLLRAVGRATTRGCCRRRRTRRRSLRTRAAARSPPSTPCVVHFGLPFVIERENVALVGAHDHDVRVRADARGQRATGADAPDRAARRRIDPRDRAVDGGDVDGVRQTPPARIPGTRLADGDLPVHGRRGRGLQLRQRAGLLACSKASATRRPAAPAGTRRSSRSRRARPASDTPRRAAAPSSARPMRRRGAITLHCFGAAGAGGAAASARAADPPRRRGRRCGAAAAAAVAGAAHPRRPARRASPGRSCGTATSRRSSRAPV